MPTQTILSSVLSSIFAKMGQIYNISIGKCRRDFVAELFRVVLAMRGRVNCTNMARFSRLDGCPISCTSWATNFG